MRQGMVQGWQGEVGASVLLRFRRMEFVLAKVHSADICVDGWIARDVDDIWSAKTTAGQVHLELSTRFILGIRDPRHELFVATFAFDDRQEVVVRTVHGLIDFRRIDGTFDDKAGASSDEHVLE